jgi:hypothetical protein
MLSHRQCGGDSSVALESFTWLTKDSLKDLYNVDDTSIRHLELKNSNGTFAMAKAFREGEGGRPAPRMEVAFAPYMGFNFKTRTRMFERPAMTISPLEYPAKLGPNATIRGHDGVLHGYFQQRGRDFILSGGRVEIRLVVEPVEIGLMIMVYSGLEQIAGVRITNHRNDIRIDLKPSHRNGADQHVVIATILATMIASQDVVNYFGSSFFAGIFS